MPIAMSGLAAISMMKVRNAVRPSTVDSRTATLAAVSHSSRRRCVMTRRMSVRMMACPISHAWYGSSISVRMACANEVSRSSARRRSSTASGCRSHGNVTRRTRVSSTGVPSTTSVSVVQNHGSARQDRPAEHEQTEERGCEQTPAKVVENLPAADQGQMVALDSAGRRHPWEQPPEDLPVAAHPSALSTSVGQHRRGKIVHDFQVGDQRDSGVQPFEQIVREEGVLGHAAVERRLEGVDVIEALAGEEAFLEQILIGVRHRGGIRVDAGVTGVDPRKDRARGARHRDADPGLQDAVAFRHPSRRAVDLRLIERVKRDADQGLGGVARQLRVGVERDAVPHVGQNRQVASGVSKSGVAGAAKQAVELLDLPALALPSHPHPFLLVPLAIAMEQVEAAAAVAGVAMVQGVDARSRGGQNVGVVRPVLGEGVGEVAEQREVNARIEVAERLNLEVREQLVDRAHAAEQGRHDHHRAAILGHAAVEFETREHPRGDQPRQAGAAPRSSPARWRG